MRTVGIICECNPFHGGHQFLIRQARTTADTVVVCVMSGNFVQRGEAAIIEKYTRAKALLAGGADVVVELPYPFCASSAEFFTACGVEILCRMGVKELWFGSECGDLSLLQPLAEIGESREFLDRYTARTSDNCGTAEAYFDCLCEILGRDVRCASNDILGIAYLRALKKQGGGMSPHTVKRMGSGYTETELPNGRNGYPSATALRRAWKREGFAAVSSCLPAETLPCYQDISAESLADLSYASSLILGYLRLTSAESLEQIAALSGGLGNRLSALSHRVTSLEALIDQATTKKYPRARIQRGLLFALTGITEADLRTSPDYVRLLAANEAGCQFLSSVRKNGGISVVTRRTDLPDTDLAARQEAWEHKAEALYAACKPTLTPSNNIWLQKPYIAKA